MRKFIIAAALVSLTAVPAFAGTLNTASISVSAGASNSVISRPSTPVSVPSRPSVPSGQQSRPSKPPG